MDKQVVEVNEMVSIMGAWALENNMCWNEEHAKSLAKHLYDAGCCKIHIDEVVVKKDEYLRLQLAERGVIEHAVPLEEMIEERILKKYNEKLLDEKQRSYEQGSKAAAKEILQGFNRFLKKAISVSYEKSVKGISFYGGKNTAFHEVKDLVKRVAESKGVEVDNESK